MPRNWGAGQEEEKAEEEESKPKPKKSKSIKERCPICEREYVDVERHIRKSHKEQDETTKKFKEQISELEEELKQQKTKMESFKDAIDELNEESEKAFDVEIAIRKFDKADIEDEFEDVFTKMMVSDRVIELDWEKVKNFLTAKKIIKKKRKIKGKITEIEDEEFILDPKTYMGGKWVKMIERIQSGRHVAFLFPLFDFINEVVLHRSSITDFVKDRYRENIVPLSADQITIEATKEFLLKEISKKK